MITSLIHPARGSAMVVNLKARLLRGSTPSCSAESTTGRQNNNNNTATERMKKKVGEEAPPRYRHTVCIRGCNRHSPEPPCDGRTGTK